MPARRLLLAAALLVATPCFAAAQPDDCAYVAGRMFDSLGHRDYSGAAFMMDGELRAHSFPKQLPSMWDALLKNNFGAYRSHGEATVTHNADGTTTLSMPLQFERMSPSFLVTCDAAGTVHDFSLQ